MTRARRSDGKQLTTTLRMPESLRDRIAAEAAKERISLNSWVLRLIDAALEPRPVADDVHTDHPLRHYDRTCPACNRAD